jgi:hypothetical protein
VVDPENRIVLNLIKLAAVSLSATWNFCGFAFFAFRPEPARPRTAERSEARL